ncbi:hypothetical protein PQR14_34730, partial [Paraburkholderia bryophila]|uniref:hypothetical protein n=1 Tax=Paraburkholderia bryophila TaxID=420952 RepID=UPI0038B713AB
APCFLSHFLNSLYFMLPLSVSQREISTTNMLYQKTKNATLKLHRIDHGKQFMPSNGDRAEVSAQTELATRAFRAHPPITRSASGSFLPKPARPSGSERRSPFSRLPPADYFNIENSNFKLSAQILDSRGIHCLPSTLQTHPTGPCDAILN